MFPLLPGDIVPAGETTGWVFGIAPTDMGGADTLPLAIGAPKAGETNPLFGNAIFRFVPAMDGPEDVWLLPPAAATMTQTIRSSELFFI
jgi:hypothetical protein